MGNAGDVGVRRELLTSTYMLRCARNDDYLMNDSRGGFETRPTV